MFSRQEQLSEIQSFIKDVDKEVTMILQSLQWDRKLLLQAKPKETCKYNVNHKIPPVSLEEHEEKCVLKCQGYAPDDVFLPDVFDPNSSTVIKLSSENIQDVINYASKTDPLFKRGNGTVTCEPLTLARLQATYTADERRAIYDVVISSRPACDELSDLALGDMGAASQGESKHKSKVERLAELRDMRRRRTKYRVAARSRNYSHTLRGLIDTQMEMYAEAQGHTKSHDKIDCNVANVTEKPQSKSLDTSSDNNTTKHRGTEERSKHDRRYHYSETENRRKRDYEEHRRSRNFEKDRYRTTTEDRETRVDQRHKRQKHNRDSCREEIDANHKNRNIKAERVSESRICSPRYSENESEVRYTKDKHVNYVKNENNSHDRTKNQRSREYDTQERYSRDKGVIYNKEERDYSSNSRDIQKYSESKKEERYYKDKDRNYSKEKKEIHSFHSRDRKRERDRDERYNRTKDRYGYRNDRSE
ncbi:U11/U12 small nuclear ribonucleoprotein 48 kDa protein [Bicyclus anynana]|uniref:U11/U12 small nuclear ribonucleoprotein 48 kDa protein n=1 Tax=Bicyclus anynana TaxID=110368 RepID=A0A6J1P2R4_BICAN|nr:U11/U12 small nuclear ribonucleoprotein 48 kDa protein [Bicyclus anynana]